MDLDRLPHQLNAEKEMKFASYVKYTSDAGLIATLRPGHRAYLAELFKAGQLVAAGPFTDDSGALFIHEATTQEEAAQLVAADPFAVGGVFTSVETRAWKLVFSDPEQLRAST
jgi:uncharacterized protein YciI